MIVAALLVALGVLSVAFTGVLLSTAQKPTWCKLPLRHEGPCDFGDTGGKVENFEGDDEEA